MRLRIIRHFRILCIIKFKIIKNALTKCFFKKLSETMRNKAHNIFCIIKLKNINNALKKNSSRNEG